MIGVLVFPDFQLLDAAGPISVFEIAPRLAGAASSTKVVPSIKIASSIKMASSIKVLPIKLAVQPKPFGIVTLRNRTLSPAAQLFIDCVRDLAKPLAKP